MSTAYVNYSLYNPLLLASPIFDCSLFHKTELFNFLSLKGILSGGGTYRLRIKTAREQNLLRTSQNDTIKIHDRLGKKKDM